MLTAIEKIDVGYGLRWGQKHEARTTKANAVQLARNFVKGVAELEQRCRDAEAGIAVTRAIRAAVFGETQDEELTPQQRELLWKVTHNAN